MTLYEEFKQNKNKLKSKNEMIHKLVIFAEENTDSDISNSKKLLSNNIISNKRI